MTQRGEHAGPGGPAARAASGGRGPLAVLDERGTVLRWSRTAERLLGVERARIIGRPVTDLLAWVDAQGLREGVTVGPVRDEDGPGRWGLWAAGPLPGGMRSGVLEAVFTQSPVGLHVLDPELRVLRVNSVAVGMRGIPEERIVGRPLTEVYARYGPATIERMAQGVLTTGVPVLNKQLQGYPLADPRREHVFSASMFRLEDETGRPLGLVAATVDVTARERAHQRLAVLHRAHERVGRSLDPLTCAQELARAAVPTLADVTAVALTDAVLRGPDSEVHPERDPKVRCAAVWPENSRDVPAVGAVLDPDAFGGPAGRLAPQVVPSGTTGPALVVPLAVRGVLLGVACFARPRRTDPFEDDDMQLAKGLAAHTAVCVDNARRYEHAHAVALALQGNLLRRARGDRSDGRPAALDTTHRYLPTGRGRGAWFDVIPLAGARVALTVGQVDGRGPDTTAAMVQLRAAVHALSALDLDPHELLARLDDTTHRLNEERTTFGEEGRLTAQCVYAVHDPVTETCAMARAGHQSLLVGLPDGSWRTSPLEESTALGEEGPPFTADEFPLPPDSTVVLLSGHLAEDATAWVRLRDQLSRAPGPSAAGLPGDEQPRLREVRLNEVRLDELPLDQAAVLVARTRALDPSDVASWDITPELSSVSRARRHTTHRLAQWGMGESAFTAELIVSELVTNAIRYGTPPIRLRLIRNRSDQTLTCEIFDAGSTAPHLRHARAGDEGGRGLFLSGELSERWGVRWADQGKTVWAETSLDD
ncbi:PAS domain-containing protein [Streptomyces sp. ISL-36]|uniref:SpoIIE family protein phosphatase n=1 Tax=Streptomyces sp. ISL-36 TaxID=2819182 RepID=UPI001BE8BD82|nr:SpoIIE family protein phosphatase [Streptomyces sp. ISL-36]MBT2443216.1 PAS domain-containing protein [Streptomyces sp. ISL-36]